MEELALHILDLVQNSIEAGARTVSIEVVEDPARDRLVITVVDDGRGMDEETVRQVLDPFYTTRTTRKVGLGLSLLAQAAQQAGGWIEVRSRPGQGTTVVASFQRSNIDRAPLGDMRGTLLVLVVGDSAVRIRYRHVVGELEFDLDSGEIREVLEDVPLDHPSVLRWLNDLLAEDPESESYSAFSGDS